MWFKDIQMSAITDKLYLGNYWNASSLATENPLGIKAVLNVSTEDPYPQNPDIIYMDLPFHDGHEIPEKAFIKAMEFLKFHHEVGNKVLVHCAAGISRSATIVASFLYYSGQFPDLGNALFHCVTLRSIINPAVLTLNSAKKHLRVWPYDGTYQEAKDCSTCGGTGFNTTRDGNRVLNKKCLRCTGTGKK